MDVDDGQTLVAGTPDAASVDSDDEEMGSRFEAAGARLRAEAAAEATAERAGVADATGDESMAAEDDSDFSDVDLDTMRERAGRHAAAKRSAQREGQTTSPRPDDSEGDDEETLEVMRARVQPRQDESSSDDDSDDEDPHYSQAIAQHADAEDVDHESNCVSTPLIDLFVRNPENLPTFLAQYVPETPEQASRAAPQSTPGKPPMPRTGWPRPLDEQNKPVKKKGHWWDAYYDEGEDQGRWIKNGRAKAQPPPGYVTDACPKCENPRDRSNLHNYGDRCEERVVDPSARCVRCDRECPRKAKTQPDENVCPACKRLVTKDAKFSALQPKREAQARKRADEGYDDNAGHTDKHRDGTALDWKSKTPDQPDKTLEQCLEVHLDAVDASGADYDSQAGEATELLRLLNGSNPKSFVDGVDYMSAVRTKVRQIRVARGRTSNKPFSPYGCASFQDWLPQMERLAQVSCDACSGPIIDFGVISVLVLLLISYNVLAFLTLHLECFCRALRNEKPDNREGAAGPESTRAMLLQNRLAVLNSRNAPLWLFRGVVLVELRICGDANYFYRTFMMTGSGPGLRLPFYKCMHAVNVMMLSSRGYSALYHAYADCFFGRMASRRAIFFAPNVKEDDEHTVGHNFLWSGYPSGAELRALVSRIEPGVRAQILVRPRLGEIVVFEWDGSDDGIYLRLRRLRRDESLTPN